MEAQLTTEDLEESKRRATTFGALGKGEYLSFMIANETYGIDILAVQEIIGYIPTTPIPNAPDFVKGVINLRGNVIPIIDLRKKFNLDDIEIDKFNVIIVIKTLEKIMGMLVDSVSDVLSIDTKDIQEIPEFSSRIQTEFLKGLGKVNDKLVILLTLDKVMSLDEIEKLPAAEELKAKTQE